MNLNGILGDKQHKVSLTFKVEGKEYTVIFFTLLNKIQCKPLLQKTQN